MHLAAPSRIISQSHPMPHSVNLCPSASAVRRPKATDAAAFQVVINPASSTVIRMEAIEAMICSLWVRMRSSSRSARLRSAISVCRASSACLRPVTSSIMETMPVIRPCPSCIGKLCHSHWMRCPPLVRLSIRLLDGCPHSRSRSNVCPFAFWPGRARESRGRAGPWPRRRSSRRRVLRPDSSPWMRESSPQTIKPFGQTAKAMR